MPAPPLTHHDIIALAAPFARAGWQVDLAASQRAERRIAFRALERPAQDDLPALRDSLLLESFGTGTCRLTRTLALHEGGLRASLQVLGPDPATLLAQLLAVEPRRAFRRGPGHAIAFSYELYPLDGTPPGRGGRGGRALPPAGEIGGEVAGGAAAAAPVPAAEPVLLRGEVRLDAGLTLQLALSAVRGVAGELTLIAGANTGPRAAGRPRLPQDVLAVLGWRWARLIETRDGWRSKLRLRGDLLRRSRDAERALEQAAQHLALTLQEPPARFHERWRTARWGVVLRRALPLATVLSVIVIALFLPREEITRNPGLVTLVFQVPIALIALSFAVQELAQFEIPPLPRRSADESWWPR
jgi:hypothetical protein